MTNDAAQPRGRKAGRGQSSSNSDPARDTTLKKGTARLDGEAQAQIGEKLKAMYDDVVSQPIPDRLRELLDQLDKHRPPGKKGEYLN